MAGPATDVEFRGAADQLRATAGALESSRLSWPNAEASLYGPSAARAATDEALAGAQRRLELVAGSLRGTAGQCDTFADGCEDYYKAYRQYVAARQQYEAAWQAFAVAHAGWQSWAQPVIVLGPPVPGGPVAPAPLASAAPEPQPPTLAAPSEPPCPSYCDPSPVR